MMSGGGANKNIQKRTRDQKYLIIAGRQPILGKHQILLITKNKILSNVSMDFHSSVGCGLFACIAATHVGIGSPIAISDL